MTAPLRCPSMLTLVVGASLALLSCASGRNAGSVHHHLPDGDRLTGEPVSSLVPMDDGSIAVVTAERIVLLDKSARVIRTVTVAGTTEVVAWNDRLVAGSVHGLQTVDVASGDVRPMLLPAINEYPAIGALAVDREGDLWVGTLGAGLYRCSGTTIVPIPAAPAITSLATTSDGSLWIGTYLGLHRLHNGRYAAYSEEIHHEGITIPDNIVDHLSVDRWGNLWVFMSKAISLFTPVQISGSGDHVDPETYAYIGSETNEVHAMASGPDRTRWFASDEGIMVLRDIEVDKGGAGHRHGLADVMAPPEGELLRASDALAELDARLAGVRCNDLVFDQSGNLWLGTESGVWCVGADAVASMISIR